MGKCNRSIRRRREWSMTGVSLITSGSLGFEMFLTLSILHVINFYFRWQAELRSPFPFPDTGCHFRLCQPVKSVCQTRFSSIPRDWGGIQMWRVGRATFIVKTKTDKEESRRFYLAIKLYRSSCPAEEISYFGASYRRREQSSNIRASGWGILKLTEC